MNPFWFWLIFGAVLMLSEFLLPGLIAVFVGMGALTVAAAIYLGHVDSIVQQILVWFVSSLIYVFTLRLLVVRFYPSDTVKQSFDEDIDLMGSIVEVTQPISAQETGRIKHGDSTWEAKSRKGETIQAGEKVKLLERTNITWTVEKI